MLYPRQPIVLMIDVDNISYKVFKKTVTRAGFTPIQLESCQGFKYLHSENVAAVVLDVEMCRNAFQTLAQIEELFPNSALIVLTGPGENVQARFAVRLGARHVVTKPCDRKELDRIFRFIAEHGAASCPATKAQATQISFQGPTLAEIERRALLAAVRAAGGDNLRAARMLGIGKTTLYRKLKQYSYGRVAHVARRTRVRASSHTTREAGAVGVKEDEGDRTEDFWGAAD